MIAWTRGESLKGALLTFATACICDETRHPYMPQLIYCGHGYARAVTTRQAASVVHTHVVVLPMVRIDVIVLKQELAICTFSNVALFAMRTQRYHLRVFSAFARFREIDK